MFCIDRNYQKVRLFPATAGLFLKIAKPFFQMKTASSSCWVRWPSSLILLGVCGLVCLFAQRSQAQVTLFNENFNGYTSFPDQVPSNDYVNKGIPEISEGASELWFGARFQSGDGSINSDLFVQKFGDYAGFNPPSNPAGNATPVGRFEDDAGLVLRINTTGYTNITLDFDWRTFDTSSGDKVTVGYYVGEIGFNTGANRFMDLRTTSANAAYSWGNWTQLMSQGDNGYPFEHETFTLNAAANAGVVYVAFWLDDGEGDYGKLDNVFITGTPILVPEPTTLSLGLLGCALVIAQRRFSR